jgi:hypothetical protein
MKLIHLLNEYEPELDTFVKTGNIDQNLYSFCFKYYVENNMPYEVGKAIHADPKEWIREQLAKEFL